MNQKQAKQIRKLTQLFFTKINEDRQSPLVRRKFYKTLKMRYKNTPKNDRRDFLQGLENEFTNFEKD